MTWLDDFLRGVGLRRGPADPAVLADTPARLSRAWHDIVRPDLAAERARLVELWEAFGFKDFLPNEIRRVLPPYLKPPTRGPNVYAYAETTSPSGRRKVFGIFEGDDSHVIVGPDGRVVHRRDGVDHWGGLFPQADYDALRAERTRIRERLEVLGHLFELRIPRQGWVPRGENPYRTIWKI